MKSIKKEQSSLSRRDNMQGWLSVLPVLVILIVFRGYPIIVGILKSFTNWDGLFRNDFIGLRNYVNILSGDQFWMLLKNNLFLLLYLPIQLFLGLIVAVLLYEETPGWKFFRSCYYLPQVLSMVSVGFLFKVIFGFDGPINEFLRSIGLESFAIEWLGEGTSAKVVIIIVMVWLNIGWQGLLFLGGMASISPEVYEAAKLDGAGYWTKMFKITLPMLIKTLEYSCVTSVLWVFTGLFSLIYTITGGGPGYETTTIDYMIYTSSFGRGSQFGYASALSVILLIIVSIASILQIRASNKADDWRN